MFDTYQPATMMHLLVCSLFVAVASHPASVLLEANPEYFNEVTTDEIVITCKPEPAPGNDNHFVQTFEIRKDGSYPLVYVHNISKVSYGDGVQQRLRTGEGYVDVKMSDSYIKWTIPSPTEDDAGTYECVMNYLDDDGIMNDTAAETTITLEVTDLETIMSILKTLRSQIKQLENSDPDVLRQMNSSIQTLAYRVGFLEEDTADHHEHLIESGQQNKENSQIAFSATNEENIITSRGQILVLPILITRVGKGYDERTGKFTAPKAGLYAFYLEAKLISAYKGIVMELRKNNEILAHLYAFDKDQSSVSSVVSLDKGDEVFCVMTLDDRVLYKDRFTVFSGYLIHPE